MLNIPKENIKAFVTIVCGLAILVGITMFIDVNFIHKSVFHEVEPDLTQYGNVAETKVEENKYNLVSEERRVLYYTDEIMDMINNKEFDKLYGMLDETYRNIYCKSVEELEEYFARFSDGEYALAYDEYYKEKDMFLIKVNFEKINLTRDDIINSKGKPVDIFCIKEIAKGKYTVSFNGFISKKTYTKETSNGLVNIKLKEMTLKADSTEILLYVENLTDEDITLYDNRMDIYLSHSGNYKYVNPNTIPKVIPAKVGIVYRITFMNIYNKDSAPKSLIFDRIYGSDEKIKPINIKL